MPAAAAAGSGRRAMAATPGTRSPVNPGIPTSRSARSGSMSRRANPRRVYASIEAPDTSGGIFRSDDGGDTWERMNGDQKFRVRMWYYSTVTADPTDENTVYVMNLTVRQSIDGGKSFNRVRVPHGDTHITVDRPEGPEADDQRQRWRGDGEPRRRDHVVEHLQPADGPVLPRHDRQPVAVSHLRSAAGQLGDLDRQPLRRRRHRRAATTFRSPGARTRTSPSIRAIRTSRTAAAIWARSRVTTSARAGARHLRLAAQLRRVWRRRCAAALSVDLPDRHLAARPNDAVCHVAVCLALARPKGRAGSESLPTSPCTTPPR